MELSVVVPAKNVAATLAAQLDALVHQHWDGAWEVLVVENGSTDGTADIAADYARRFDRVRVIQATGGAGVNWARNVGIAAAAADHIAMCDGDDVAADGWVACMGDALRTQPFVTGPIDATKLNPEWLVRTRGLDENLELRYWYGIFPLAAGGNLGVHRDAWEQVGRFDEHIVGAVDDAEFCLRMWQAGYQVQFLRDAVVHYRYRSETKALWRQGRFYGKGKPLINKRLRAAGLPTPPRLAGWKSWALLALWAPRLRSRHGRAAWCWVAGNRIGQIEGCWYHRTLWL